MPMTTEEYAQRIVDLVNAAVEAEREACAKVAEGYHDHAECGHGEGYMDGRHDAAAAILARTK